ncbi:Uncharacterised protein [Vibrio cholerae]|nr:Uncharacterised protein [Vibrio cholerae]CSI40134.1 Uncharacterised protein [Vibrio cholerae]
MRGQEPPESRRERSHFQDDILVLVPTPCALSFGCKGSDWQNRLKSQSH